MTFILGSLPTLVLTCTLFGEDCPHAQAFKHFDSIHFKTTYAWGWCTGTTQRDGMGREEGGGFRMGNTCIPVVDSF